MLLCALLSPCASVRDTALRVRAHSLPGLSSVPCRSVLVFEPMGDAAHLGDAAPLHQCVLEAKRRGHRVWVGVIPRIGTNEQSIFSSPWETSPNS